MHRRSRDSSGAPLPRVSARRRTCRSRGERTFSQLLLARLCLPRASLSAGGDRVTMLSDAFDGTSVLWPRVVVVVVRSPRIIARNCREPLELFSE